MREVQQAADRLCLVAHDPATGRPRLGPRQLGLGLAAGLLGELLVGGLIELADGLVHASDREPHLRRVRHDSGGLSIMGRCVESHRRVAPDKAAEPCSWCGIAGVEVFPDRMVWDTRQLIARERTDRPVLDWLTVLSADAPGMVAQRLTEDEWLVAEYRRSLWSGRVLRSWVPANVVEADGARQALRRIARGLNRQPGPHECLVAGLAARSPHGAAEVAGPDTRSAMGSTGTGAGTPRGTGRAAVDVGRHGRQCWQRRADWAAGFAVRRELPGGTHDLICFRLREGRAVRAARRDCGFWRRGPWRPLAHAVVPVSRRDFDLHRRRGDCRSPDCPQPVVRLDGVVW